MTNADRIRNMSDEELAEFLDIVEEDGISSQYANLPCDCCCEKTECSKCWKEWLRLEAEQERRMEDRYLFKAKTARIVDSFNNAKDGIWVKGYLKCDTGKWEISQFEYDRADHVRYEIDPSTICQCTGLKDKNGNLIWENDIIKDLFSDVYAQIKYGSYQSCFDSTKTEHVGFYVDWSGKYTKRYRKDLGYWINMVDAEIAGNAFDNVELLESEGEYDRE